VSVWPIGDEADGKFGRDSCPGPSNICGSRIAKPRWQLSFFNKLEQIFTLSIFLHLDDAKKQISIGGFLEGGKALCLLMCFQDPTPNSKPVEWKSGVSLCLVLAGSLGRRPLGARTRHLHIY